MVSNDQAADVALMMVDRCRELLAKLNDADLERVVLLKLDGYTNQEIADQMKYSRRTIQRMLNIIKEIWGEHAR